MKFSDIKFEDIVKVGNKSFLHRNLFNVNWLLGRYCNYSCSYCWPYAHTKEKDHRPFEVIKNTIDMIFNQGKTRGYDEFSFSFSGGEPTLHPDFLKIVSHISTEKSRINLTTNLSRNMTFWEQLTEKRTILSITASFHPEFIEAYRFLEKLKYLKDRGVYLQVNIVLLHNYFDLMWNYAQYFYENGISVQAKIEVEYKDDTTIEKPYTDDQLDKIKNGFPKITEADYTFEMTDKNGQIHLVDNVERVVGLGFNRFEDWICEAGYRSIVIHEPTGFIKRHYLCHDEPIGHIETGFKLYNRPRICFTEICGSCADCKIPKFKEDSCYSAHYPGSFKQ